MSIDILMPALSPTMEEGKLAKWLKSEGDTVEAGDVIAEIETDKATMEVEAVDEGVLGKILISEGTENVKVNTKIAVLLEDGESADAINDNESTQSEESASESSEEAKEEAPSFDISSAEQPEGEVVEDRDILYAQGAVLPPEPFDEASFMADTKESTVREALRDAMAEEMRDDRSAVDNPLKRFNA